MNELSEQSIQWLNQAKARFDPMDRPTLAAACQFAEAVNEKIPIYSADSVLDQGLGMANELLDLNCDHNTLAAAIAYPAVYHGKINKDTIIKQLGGNIYTLLSNTQRIDSVERMLTSASQQKIDNLRKMVLAIVDDIRIVFIKLAECLVILKYFRKHDVPEKKALAQHTMDLYAPLANRLGMGQLKWQLEDLSFRYLHEKDYQAIKSALNMRRSDRDEYIRLLVDQMKQRFDNENIKTLSINGRAKHIYSIYRKMQKKGISFEQLYDTIAFRILVPNLEDCYTALSIVHAEWPHIKTEFDDYIAKPKPNGYQSIHTAVTGPKGINIEIQIRTVQMHNDAELGVAAHWKYKEGGKQSRYEEKINRLREMMTWQQDETPSEKNIYSKVFEDQIYVFTPQGDVFDLTSGATPLDFAYRLHTDVGHRCRGAKINDVLVPLTQPLTTGDRIEILTAKEPKPSRDWLNPNLGYISTQQAISKVRHWFKKTNFAHNLELGQLLWEKKCRRSGFKKSDINKVYQRFNFKTPNDLLAAIGNNDIGVVTVINYLKEDITGIKKPPTDATVPQKSPYRKQIPSNLIVAGVGELLSTIAKCCSPIPGDDILGYVTKNRGVSIHHHNCHNIKQAQAYRPERVLDVNWGKQLTKTYPVTLTIDADNRAELVRDITTLIANEKINLLGLHSTVDAIKEDAYLHLTIEIKSLDSLDKLLVKIRSIPAVFSVKRT